ncbi:hypothetical protein H072_8549 [Dactylellina haptotyla CBS 200.50]|uniref:Azaphilone pigments biosynthesis cluster protein L N-terminal domain-containing protein n=1 Tax=Dactylellina haptotyla (strain CBS 200.50) TaxID=1284197 RepID=S8A403_DACHA|nr:hypothetical protein H072_8549 [Dactylellina haptotyla CBS 200.50]
MDPLSITTGVVGLISSLASLSLKINDFYDDFRSADAEIRDLTTQVDSLGLTLKRLDDIKGAIAPNALNDLSKILQRLGTVINEIELFITTTSARRLRGSYWALTGKKQCIQLGRRLDQYKSTLNITLTLVTISSGQELQERGDEILGGIHNILQAIRGTDDYLLQRYLAELETVYEMSTATDQTETTVSEDSQQAQTAYYRPQHTSIPYMNSPQPPRIQSTRPQPPHYIPEVSSHSYSPTSSISNHSDTTLAPTHTPIHPVTNVQSVPSPSGLRTIDHWRSIPKSTKHTYTFPTKPSRKSLPVFAARGGYFAVCIQGGGLIYTGKIGEPNTPLSASLPIEEYWPSTEPERRRTEEQVPALEFQDDRGTLIAALHRPGEFCVVSWGPGQFPSGFERISPVLKGKSSGSWIRGDRCTISPNGRFLSYPGDRGEVRIFDIRNNKSLNPIPGGKRRRVEKTAWSQDGLQMLIVSKGTSQGSDEAEEDLQIFQIDGGQEIFHTTPRKLGFMKDVWWWCCEFYLAGLDRDVNIVGGTLSYSSKQSMLRRLSIKRTDVADISGYHAFWGNFNPRADSNVILKRTGAENDGMYWEPRFSSDGSCFLGYDWKKHRVQLVGSGSDGKVKTINFPKHLYANSTYGFDHEGNHVLAVEPYPYTASRDAELHIWEPSF